MKLAKLFIYTPHQSGSIAKVFMSNPDENRLQFFGNLFGFIEFEQKDKNLFPLLDEIVMEIEDTYYDFSLVAQQQAFDVGTHFENSLNIINTKVQNILMRNNLEKDVDSFHIILGVAKNNSIQFSYVKNVYAFLVFRNSTNQYKMADIIGNYQEGPNTHATDVFRIFAYTLNGQFRPNDYLIFCNKNLLDNITLDQLKDAVVGKTVEEGVEEIRNYLWQASVNTTFTTVLIFNKSDIDTGRRRETQDVTPQKSINKLLHTEDTTEKLLSMSILPNLFKYKKMLLGVMDKGKQGLKFRVAQKSHILDARDNFSKILSFFKSFLTGAWHIIKKTQSMLAKGFKGAMDHRRSLWEWREFKRVICRLRGKAALRVKELSLWQKIGAVVGVTLVIVFIAGISGMKDKKAREQEEANYQTSVNDAQTALNEAEATLIYKDTTKALAILGRAQNLITKIPTNTTERREKAEGFNTTVKKYLNNLRKVILIENAELQFDGSNILAGGKNPALRGFSVQNGVMVAWSETGILYKLFSKDNKAVPVAKNTTTQGLIVRSTFSDDEKYLLLISNKNELLRFDFDKETLEQTTLVLSEREKNITDIALYNNKLYILTANDNQIYRHSSTLAGFGLGSPWSKEKETNLKQGAGIVIDSSIYVVNNNGSVNKFSGGKKIDFTLEKIDPPIKEAFAIWTNATSNFLYIFEPKNSRVAAFQKESGKFVNQYYTPNFNELKHFVVDEKEKTLYLLNNNSIYRTKLEHMQ